MTIRASVAAAGLKAAKAIQKSRGERTPRQWLDYYVSQNTKPWDSTKPHVECILGYIEHATHRPLDEIENDRAAAEALKNASIALQE